MLSRFRRPAADFRVELSETAFRPGDELQVRVSLVPRDGFQVRRGRVEILCVESYVDRVDNVRTSSYGSGTRKLGLTHIRNRYEKVIMDDVRLRRGLPRYFDVDWTVPLDAVPTAAGASSDMNDVGITWMVRTSLDVAGARDFNDRQEITVLCPATDADGSPSPVVAEDADDECALTLTLDEGIARPSDTIEGSLRAELLTDMSLSEVRAELFRVEVFGYEGEDYHEDSVILESDVALRRGETREWRFQLKIGQVHAPSLRTELSSVTWLVRGVLAKRMRLDTRIEQEIRVVV